MNDVKNVPAGLRVLEENEILAVSGGTDPVETDPTINRVKTSDKQQKAVLDFVKG